MLAALGAALSGCTGPRPLHGGHAQMSGPVAQAVVQGENPAGATRQGQETVRVRSYTVPAGSVVCETGQTGWEDTSNFKLQTSKAKNSKERSSEAKPQDSNYGPQISYTLAAPMPVSEREETRASTELGAAQKDTARELGAKLSSLKGIVWVGLALFTFGIASLFWPPLQTVIGSVTTSVAITFGGLALMILPTLIVGNELLILAAVTLAVGGWFLAHRHGQLRGQLAAAGPKRRAAEKRSSGVVK